jgi:hypothetical protein
MCADRFWRGCGAVVLGGLVLALAAPPVVAQEAGTADTGVIDAGTVVDPSATPTPAPAEATPAAEGTVEPESAGDGTVTDVPAAEAMRTEPGYGNASHQPPAGKRAEAEADCVTNRPPVNAMQAVAGAVATEAGSAWSWVPFAIAVAAAIVALVAFALRRGWRLAGRSRLETVATLVAILGGVAGLAAQFVPGVGAHERPQPEATMRVREVHSRITRGEYARKTGSKVKLEREDRREVGNVVWLEIGLQGYNHAKPVLQYGLYDRDLPVPALLRGTEKSVDVRVEDADAQTLFVPIWIGYPRSKHFEAQFRLLEGDKVRQMASTDRMEGSEYRYACTTTS